MVQAHVLRHAASTVRPPTEASCKQALAPGAAGRARAGNRAHVVFMSVGGRVFMSLLLPREDVAVLRCVRAAR